MSEVIREAVRRLFVEIDETGSINLKINQTKRDPSTVSFLELLITNHGRIKKL